MIGSFSNKQINKMNMKISGNKGVSDRVIILRKWAVKFEISISFYCQMLPLLINPLRSTVGK